MNPKIRVMAVILFIATNAQASDKIETPYAGAQPDKAAESGQWRFEEGIGGTPATAPASILDSSGNGYNGTPYGGPTYMRDSAPASSLGDTLSLHFDGADDFLAFGSQFPFHLPGDATIEFLIKSNFEATNASMFWTRPDPNTGPENDNNRFNIYLLGDKLCFDYRAPNGTLHRFVDEATGGVPLTHNQWNHIAIVRRGNTYSVFVNGTLRVEVTDASPDLPNSTGWTISGRRQSYAYYKGLLDAVKFSRVALRPAEFLIGDGNPPLPDVWTEDFSSFAASDPRYALAGTVSGCPSWDPVRQALRLTTATTNAAGRLIYNRLVSTDHFDVRFDFQLDGEADGVLFAWSPTPMIGTSPHGGTLYWQGGTGYGVEIDTWKDGVNDLDAHHIAIVKDGWETHLASTTFVHDGIWHNLRVANDLGDIRIWYDDLEILQYQIPGYGLNEAYFRFSSATGIYAVQHSIDNINAQSGLGVFCVDVSDVTADQGGHLSAAWRRHAFDAAGIANPISAYDVQRFGAVWETIATVAAAQLDSYSVGFSTEDVLTIGQVAPRSLYRVVARTATPATFFESGADTAGSIDNLPPAAPTLEIHDGETYRTLSWASDVAPDMNETCIYRDFTPGFAAGDPVMCSTVQNFYFETHLARYYYRARSFDIHGNASAWSDEVIGRWPTPVPGPVPHALKLYPCQPNPFNPRTMIKFDLPVAGTVRLAVFDLAGRLMRTLVGEDMSPGSHEVLWDGRDVAGREVGSGTYLARLEFNGKVQTIRMGLVR